jgi:hypothetical protein
MAFRATPDFSVLPESLYPNSFTFVVGHQPYNCSRVVADFLSPKISRLHEVDPSIDRIELRTADDSKQFEHFLSLATGQSIELTKQTFPFWLSLSEELENRELMSFVAQSEHSQLNNDTVLPLLISKENLKMNCDQELSFLASHFEELCELDLSELGVDRHYQLFAHADFRLSNEDFLYAYVLRMSKRRPDYLCLLEFVHFEFLSESTICEFIEDSCGFWRSLNLSVWIRICDRLRSHKSETGKPTRNLMRVFVHSLAFPVLWIDLTPLATVRMLKQAIQDRTSVPVENQQLVVNRAVVGDGLVGDCGIVAGSQINLTVSSSRLFRVTVRTHEDKVLTFEVNELVTVGDVCVWLRKSGDLPNGDFEVLCRETKTERAVRIADLGAEPELSIVVVVPVVFPILVRGFAPSRSLVLSVESGTSVEQLQMMIELRCGVPSHFQFLTCNARPLSSGTLGENGVASGSSVIVTVGGGMPRSASQ